MGRGRERIGGWKAKRNGGGERRGGAVTEEGTGARRDVCVPSSGHLACVGFGLFWSTTALRDPPPALRRLPEGSGRGGGCRAVEMETSGCATTTRIRARRAAYAPRLGKREGIGGSWERGAALSHSATAHEPGVVRSRCACHGIAGRRNGPTCSALSANSRDRSWLDLDLPTLAKPDMVVSVWSMVVCEFVAGHGLRVM
jgi:hypothetical protein